MLMINFTLLQESKKLADWRSVIPYLLGLRSSVALLPSCLCGDTVLVVPRKRHSLSRCLRARSGACTYQLRPFKSAAGPD